MSAITEPKTYSPWVGEFRSWLKLWKARSIPLTSISPADNYEAPTLIATPTFADEWDLTFPPDDFVVDRLMTADSYNMIVSDAGGGKSTTKYHFNKAFLSQGSLGGRQIMKLRYPPDYLVPVLEEIENEKREGLKALDIERLKGMMGDTPLHDDTGEN